jgi:hypothetical protein
MNHIYNDPETEGTVVSSCSTPISLGWVIVLTDDTRPRFSPCNKNAWMIDEDEINDMREFVSSELSGGTANDN